MDLHWLNKYDNSKYFIAATAIIASLTRENLVTELGHCYPDIYKNDIMQILITASTMFIFVRDFKISIQAALILYVGIFFIHKFTNHNECLANTEQTLEDIKNIIIKPEKEN